MLKCETIQPQLSTYLDREMPLWKVRIIQWHLRGCPSCAHEAMRLRQADKILRQLDAVKTSDSFLTDVMHKVSTITTTEKYQIPVIRRVLRRLESSLAWVRYSFRTRVRPHAIVTSLALIMIVVSVATLYQPWRLPLPLENTLTLTQSLRDKQIVLVEFEIVLIDQSPKPHVPSDRHAPDRTNP